MTHQQDYKGDLRSAFTMREIENAQRSVHTGIEGLFVRAALSAIFMYLIFISYLMLGIAGPVFISVLFLVALFVPYFYQAVKDLLKRWGMQKQKHVLGRESPQQG